MCLIKKDKTNWKFLLIVIVLAAVAGGGILFYNNRIENNKPYSDNNFWVKNLEKAAQKETANNNENANNIEEKVANQILDDEAKALFHATEIINNDLPDSIEFWTEAYCPGSGTAYEYKFTGIKIYDYIFDSCTEEGFGIHGGCETCMMSKMKLIKTPSDLQKISLQQFSYFGSLCLTPEGECRDEFSDCGKPVQCEFLRKEEYGSTTFRYYNVFSQITEKVKVEVYGWTTGDNYEYLGEHFNVASFSILDGEKEIDIHDVEFDGFTEPGLVEIFDYNNKKYLLVHGGTYGNKGGTSEFFLYVIKEDGHVAPVKSSWGGTFQWTCDELNENCRLEYALGYKKNLYLMIGEDIWDIGENDIFQNKIHALSAVIDENGLQFITAKTETPVHLGFCGFNISTAGVPSEITLPEELKGLNYGEVVVDEEFCYIVNPFAMLFGGSCVPYASCREKGVIPNSPADKAGIISRDIILELDGIKLVEGEIDKLLANHKSGESVTLKVLRDGKINTINVKLEEEPGDLDPSF